MQDYKVFRESHNTISRYVVTIGMKLTRDKEGSIWSGGPEAGGNEAEVEAVANGERRQSTHNLIGCQSRLTLEENRDGSTHDRSGERSPAQKLGAVIAEIVCPEDTVSGGKDIDAGTVACGEVESVTVGAPGNSYDVGRTCGARAAGVPCSVPRSNHNGYTAPVQSLDGVVDRLSVAAAEGHGDHGGPAPRRYGPHDVVQSGQRRAPWSSVLAVQDPDAVNGRLLCRTVPLARCVAGHVRTVTVAVPAQSGFPEVFVHGVEPAILCPVSKLLMSVGDTGVQHVDVYSFSVTDRVVESVERELPLVQSVEVVG